MTQARAVAVLFLAVLVTACAGTGTPTSSPGSMDDVIANLVLRGATVHRLVSGEPGCPSSELHNNAVYLEVALFNQSALHQIYLLRWRRQSDFDAAAAAFTECVTEYQTLNPGAQVSQLQVAPWRAYGPAWDDGLKGIVEDALRATGGV